MNSRTSLSIKNFRVFDEAGVNIELAPITILTGCNSSGKSSITKAVLLLDSFLKQIKKARENNHTIEIDKYKLDSTEDLFRQLGGFYNVLHKGSQNKEITLEYVVYSYMLSKYVWVELVFGANKNDKLNNGYLNSITLRTREGEFFHTDRTNGNRFNLNLIKKNAIDFLAIEYEVQKYCNLYSSNNVPKAEFEKIKKQVESYLDRCDTVRKLDVTHYVRTAITNNSIVSRCNVDPKVVSWSLNNEYSLFYIPVIDELNHICKNDIKKYIENKFLSKASNKLKAYSYRIIDDYITSKEETFCEYFRKYEFQFLNKCSIQKPFSLKHNNFLDSIRTFYIGDDKEKMIDVNEIKNKNVDFEMLYEILVIFNRMLYDAENEYYTKWELLIGTTDAMTDHYMFNNLITTFANDLIFEVIIPEWCGNISYASSSRTKVQRLYTFDDKNDFTELLKKYFDNKRDFYDKKSFRYEPDSFMNYWVKKNEENNTFGIGERIELLTDDESLGVKIRLHKNADDKNGILLADEGYGITSLVNILLQIETAILSSKGIYNNRKGLDNLDNLDPNNFLRYQTIVIEEPEIHLHPKYQSLLADMMLYAYDNYNIHFIVETHSEYLIRKSQVLVSRMNFIDNEDSDLNNPFKTYYVPIGAKPYSLGYRKDGKFAESFGPGFYDEAANLTFEIM